MKKTNIMALSMSALIATTSAVAGTEVDALKDRVTALESNTPKFEMGGAIEVVYGKNGDDTADADKKKIYVDSVELVVTGNINEDFNAAVTLLAEQDGDTADSDLGSVGVDAVELNGRVGGIDFTVGKFGADFGDGDFGDTTVRAVKISTEISGITLSTFVGNSSNRGLAAEYATEQFTAGIQAIRDTSNEEDTGVGGDALKDDTSNNTGLTIYAEVPFGDTTVSLKQVKVDGDSDDASQRDAEWVKLGVEHTMGDFTFAISAEELEAADATDSVETITLDVAYAITEGVSLEIEREKDKGAKAEVEAKLIYEF